MVGLGRYRAVVGPKVNPSQYIGLADFPCRVSVSADGMEREEPEWACKKEKNHKVRVRMLAACMMRVFDMSVGEAAGIQVRCPMWARNRLRRYDKAAPIPSRILPDADCPKVSQIRLDAIISKTSC